MTTTIIFAVSPSGSIENNFGVVFIHRKVYICNVCYIHMYILYHSRTKGWTHCIQLINELLALKKNEWLPSLLQDDSRVTKWYLITYSHSKNTKTWTMQTIAKILCDFNDIIIYARSLVANLKVHESIRVYDVLWMV